ncbi:MAG: hypothetical protein KDA65_11455 [Planctomycetaceae bacterium]|nr:hypothetical protein [Planctomycetaceae bacterium]
MFQHSRHLLIPFVRMVGTLRMLFACLLIGLFVDGSANAQDNNFLPTDQIEVRKSNTGLTNRLKGQIIDFNGEELQFRDSSDNLIHFFAAEDILQTRYQQSPEHQQGAELLEQRKYEEAERVLETALKVEPREWVRRELLALQIQVALARYDYEKAGNRFIALTSSDQQTRHFHLIPLNWRVPERASDEKPHSFPGEVSEATAQRWLADSDPVAQLLGASWLLFREPDSTKLSRIFSQLSRNVNERISSPHQMRVWRQYVYEGRYSERELTHWESRIESLDQLDRSGPYYLLATAYAQKLEHDHAAVRWLWLKANQSPDHFLASDAQLRAAEALVQTGLTRQAVIVYRELAEAYPESPAGKLAIERLQPPSP